MGDSGPHAFRTSGERMGYTTDFIGHFDITPALNDSEQAYLTAFARSRRSRLSRSPYDVPGNPTAAQIESTLGALTDRQRDRDNQTAVGQPGLWCDWVPSHGGGALCWNGGEKFYDSAAWLEYLINHFLRPGAAAARSGLPYFNEFTFDHVLDGVVAGNRRDNRELFLIDVNHNQVEKIVVREGMPEYWRYLDELDYEKAVDAWAANRRRPPSLRVIRRSDGPVEPAGRAEPAEPAEPAG